MGDEDKIMKKSKVLVEKEPVLEATPAFVAAKPRRMSFEQWATNKSIPSRHFRGMKAWLKDSNVPRSEEAWDKAFVGY